MNKKKLLNLLNITFLVLGILGLIANGDTELTSIWAGVFVVSLPNLIYNNK